jgi:ABC-2 type transport system ATP-binding protein
MREACVEESAIHTDNLTRTFGATRAIDGITLTVPAGAAFALLGPRKSGKTTIIRLLLGLLPPTSGRASVLGFDTVTQGDLIRQHTGALLADSGLYTRLTAVDNLDFFGRIWRMNAADRRSRSRDLLSRLGIWEARDALVGSMDELTRRRLSLARALFHSPNLLFVDDLTEHLAHPDAVSIRRDLAQMVAHEGVTLFLATQSLLEAETLCSSLAVLRQGELIAAGRLVELRAQRAAPTVEIVGRGFTDHVMALINRRSEITLVRRLDNRLLLHLTGDVDTAPIVSLLVEAGIDVEEVRKHPADLSTAFDELLLEEA